MSKIIFIIIFYFTEIKMLTNTDNRDRTPNHEDDNSWNDLQQETNSSSKILKSEEDQSLDNCSSLKESYPTKNTIELEEDKKKQDYYTKSEWIQPKTNFGKQDIEQSCIPIREDQSDPNKNKRTLEEEIKTKQEI